MTDLPAGAYEHLITRGLQRRLEALDSDLVARAGLDAADSHEVIGRHLATMAERALKAVPGQGPARLLAQLELANTIATAIHDAAPRAVDDDDFLTTPAELLTAVAARPPAPLPVTFPARPETPLASGALLTNGRGQPRIGTEVAREMASADEVYLLCAFIKWHGVRLLQDSIRELAARGGRLRIITTTYMGATEQRALDRLVELGAEVRISYETRTTRLHAKSWLFQRSTGTSTAYVGSSNLSKSALIDGLEWNVRLSQLEQDALVETIRKTFIEYWHDPAFEAYDPANAKDRDRLEAALTHASGPKPGDLPIDIANIDVRPYPYQQEILERLEAERSVHGRRHNLVVMATGTGKTVVAALDYRRLRGQGIRSLLFVAHQERILRQSLTVFRQVLRDGTFGELFVDGQRPAQWQHVFASVQSLHARGVDEWDPSRFDMVIVDEFHHAEAATYQNLLRHLQPNVLLGLTATPERADGLDVRRWFDGHTAVELRLWEALERQLLAPFQYFGIHDEVDLAALRWRRGAGYDIAELENVYTGDDSRVRLIVESVRNTVDVARMRGIGFCVSINHAEFMAQRFNRVGIPARALHSRVHSAEQRSAVRELEGGDLKMLFTVDLFNEGVDLPRVDTILMLRPTESATIFLQQLGRGLRLADDKPCLTVLDFIGGQNAQFRFDLRYRALTGASRRRLVSDVEADFPTLPAGCHIELDRVAKRIVLDNIQAALRRQRRDVVAELRSLRDLTLDDFLTETGLELEDLYRRKTWRGWTGLREEAGLEISSGPDDLALSTAIGRMLHLDDPDRIGALRELAAGRKVGGRLGAMMSQSLWGDLRADSASRLAQFPRRRTELLQIADVLESRIERVTPAVDQSGVNPLRLHARYTRNEICVAFGLEDPSNIREGVKWVPAEKADVFFVTLTKTEQHYSPTTMYQDMAITETLFQWESQSTTSSASATGQRYIHHRRLGSSVHLFIREVKNADGDLGAPPYLYAGPMTYVRHTGDRPMRIEWQLTHPLPADVYHAARLMAA
ncbi:helicase [Actinoplanes sp. NBRC 14428]|nr:helicase [Actinoplanes sp. NBRC 14428]